MTNRPERRTQRSSNPAEAMRLYLESVAQQADAQAVVVADADGLLISGTGAARESLRDLAATCLLNEAEVHELDPDPASFAGQRLTIEGEPFYLGVRGGQTAPGPEVAFAMARILL